MSSPVFVLAAHDASPSRASEDSNGGPLLPYATSPQSAADESALRARDPLPHGYFANNPQIIGLPAHSTSSNDPSLIAQPRSAAICYTLHDLLRLQKSPLIAPPDGMPSLKDWFGEWTEPAPGRNKEHDGTAAKSRYRREGESDDATRQLGLRSTFPQPSQMGNFRHQSFRDRAERDAIDREKDTASLKSMAERYDRGDRVIGLASGLSALTARTKDRESAPHLTTSRSSLSSLPRRPTEPRDGKPRRVGDDAPDWRRNAEPTRQSEGREYSRRERDSSKSRGEENGFERRRRDRSPPDDDIRKWRTTDSSTRPERRDRKEPDDRERERRGREDSSERADTDPRNGSSPTRFRRKTEEDERAEARRRKDERDREKETPAWMDDYVPDASVKNTLLGISSDGMDELQRWKQEKREKEMRRDAEAVAVATLPTPPEPMPPTITAHTPPTHPTNGQAPTSPFSPQDPPSSGISFLEQLKQAANYAADVSPISHNHWDADRERERDLCNDPSSTVNVEVSPPQGQFSSFAHLLSAHSQSAETNSLSSGPPSATLSPTMDPIATAADFRRPHKDFSPPPMSRHAFAQPRNVGAISPAPTDTSSVSASRKPSAQPQALRTIQSVEPSHRTSNLGDQPRSVSGASQHTRVVSGGSSQGGQPRPPAPNGPAPARQTLSGQLFHPTDEPREIYPSLPQFVSPRNASPIPGATMPVNPNAVRVDSSSPPAGLLARLGIIDNQGGRSGAKPNNLGALNPLDSRQMPGHLQPPPSAQSLQYPMQSHGLGVGRGEERTLYEPQPSRLEMLQTNINDPRYGSMPTSASSTSTFDSASMSAGNSGKNFAPQGSRFAKWFDQPQRGDTGSTGTMSPPVQDLGPPPIPPRGGLMGATPPASDTSLQDLLAILQNSQNGLGGPPGLGRLPPSMQQQQALYREREREREDILAARALQQQREAQIRDARLMEHRDREALVRRQQQQQQMFAAQNGDFEHRGSFVSNDLVPGLRPLIQTRDRDLFDQQQRMDDRLGFNVVPQNSGRLGPMPGQESLHLRSLQQQQQQLYAQQEPGLGQGRMGINGFDGFSGSGMGGGSLGNGMGGVMGRQNLLQQLQQQHQQQLLEQRRLEQQRLEQQQQRVEQQRLEQARQQALLAQLGGRGQALGPHGALTSGQNVGGAGRIPGNHLAQLQLGARQVLDQYPEPLSAGNRIPYHDGPSLGGYGSDSSSSGINRLVPGSNRGYGMNQGGGGHLNGFDNIRQHQMGGTLQSQHLPQRGLGGDTSVDMRFQQHNHLGYEAGSGRSIQGSQHNGGFPQQQQHNAAPDLMALLLGRQTNGQN